MRHSAMRDMLSRRSMMDRRNPYGSRGGYVSSDRRGRDYTGMGDYARGREYARRYNDMAYDQSNYARDRNYSQSDRQSGSDYGYDYNMGMRDRNDYARRYGYFDYNTEDYARNRDYRDYRDYAEDDYKLSKKEIREWNKKLQKEGGKYTEEQIMPLAQQMGIRFDEFSPELLTAVTNMMMTDYGMVINADLPMYVKLAKAFLCDEDFDGEPEEKAYLYYKSIVEQED